MPNEQLILFTESTTIKNGETIMEISDGWAVVKDGIYSYWSSLRRDALAGHLNLRYSEYRSAPAISMAIPRVKKALCDMLWKRSKRKGYRIVKVRRIYLGPGAYDAIKEVYDWVNGIGKGGKKIRRGPYDSHIPNRLLDPLFKLVERSTADG